MAAIRAGRLDVLVLLGHKRQRIGLGAADGRWMSEAVFAAWASRERSDKSGRQTLSHGRDRVRYVPFRPQWRILGVDNLGELKAARTTRRNMLLRGNRLPLGDQESVGRDAQRGVVVEAAPSTALEVAEPDLLLEFLIVTFDTPPQLCEVDQALQSDALRKGREPVFVGALSPLGHSINSHSSGRGSLRLTSLRATRIRTRAKREDRRSAMPSRHSTLCQARLGKLNASSLTEIG